MFELKQDEKSFWETMTPARLLKLLRARFKPQVDNKSPDDKGNPFSKSKTRYVDLDTPADNKIPLAQYFNGGG